MRATLTVILGVLGFGTATANAETLATGQVWTFSDAPTADARIIIGDVETIWDDKETAVSVSVVRLQKVRFTNGELGGDEIFHIPFAKDELTKHLIKKSDEKLTAPEGYVEGYGVWKAAIDAGEAGVFTIPPAKVIDIVTQATLGAQ
ncbi:MAG: hypothetical protein ABNH53_06725 [Henriciella sp.]